MQVNKQINLYQKPKWLSCSNIILHLTQPNYTILSITFILQVALVLSALVAGSLAQYAPAPIVHDEPAVYSYQYGVHDDYSGANFAQNENRDGYATSGSYTVALPDGRTQTVNYHVADAASGYVADVTYDGVPTYGPGPAVAHAPVVAHRPVAVAHAPIAVAHAPLVAHGIAHGAVLRG